MELDITVEFGSVRALNISAANAGQVIEAGLVKLLGWSVVETSGAAAASFTLATGQTVVGEVAMAASQSASHSLPRDGVTCPQGLSMPSAAGAFTGCAYVCYPSY